MLRETSRSPSLSSALSLFVSFSVCTQTSAQSVSVSSFLLKSVVLLLRHESERTSLKKVSQNSAVFSLEMSASTVALRRNSGSSSGDAMAQTRSAIQCRAATDSDRWWSTRKSKREGEKGEKRERRESADQPRNEVTCTKRKLAKRRLTLPKQVDFKSCAYAVTVHSQLRSSLPSS